ncbi:MAG: hypothetical protein P8J32_09070 [bacterium]|nr:hypothetical protein [bacterium]
MSKKRILSLVENFVKAFETKYNLISEADEEVKPQINPQSNAMRKQVINKLVSPGDDANSKPPADMQRAEELAKAIISQGSRGRFQTPDGGKSTINYQTVIGRPGEKTAGATKETQTYDLAIELLVQAYNTPEGQPGPLGLSAVTPEMKRKILDGLKSMFSLFKDNGDPSPLLWFVYGNRMFSKNPGSLPPIPKKKKADGTGEYPDTMAMQEYAAEAFQVLMNNFEKIITRNISDADQKTAAYVNVVLRNALMKIQKKAAKGDDLGISGMRGDTQARGYSMDTAFHDRDAMGAGDSKFFYQVHKGDQGEAYFDISKYGDIGKQAAQDIEAALYAMPGTKPPMHQKQMYSAVVSNNEKFDSLKSFSEWMADNASQFPAIAEYLGNWPGQDQKFYVKKIMNELGSLFKSGKFLKIRQQIFDDKYAKMIQGNPEMGAAFAGDFFGLDKSPEASVSTPMDTRIDGEDGKEYDMDDSYDMDAYYASLEEAVSYRLFEYALNSTLLIA